MAPFRSPAGHLALLLTLILWVGGMTATQVHGVSVLHVTCDEHGEIVEVTAAHGDRAHAAGDPLEDHAHGCLFEDVVLAAIPTLALAVPERERIQPREVHEPGVGGPRAPPLSYAPKTSPPLA